MRCPGLVGRNGLPSSVEGEGRRAIGSIVIPLPEERLRPWPTDAPKACNLGDRGTAYAREGDAVRRTESRGERGLLGRKPTGPPLFCFSIARAMI